MKFWLLTLTQNQVLWLAMLKNNLRRRRRMKKKENNNNNNKSSSKPQQKSHNKHWPAKSSTQLHCRLCSSRGQRKGTVYKCAKLDVGLCMMPCFVEYHTKVNL